MIKEVKVILKKYEAIKGHSEYISISEVIGDLNYLLSEARVKRILKKER